MAKTRKTDRRIRYTKKAIQGAFLRVKKIKEYNAITVADICREAGISRGTFYAHFGNIAEVLDTLLDDALSGMDYLQEYLSAPQPDAKCAHPFCRFVRENTEMRCILFDDALGHIVVKKLAELYKETSIQAIRSRGTSLTVQEAEVIFYFQINGCFAVSKQYRNLENEEWCPVQNVIDQFIKAGISCFPAAPA